MSTKKLTFRTETSLSINAKKGVVDMNNSSSPLLDRSPGRRIISAPRPMLPNDYAVGRLSQHKSAITDVSTYARLGKDIKRVGEKTSIGRDGQTHVLQVWSASAWSEGSIKRMRWTTPIGNLVPKPYQLIKYHPRDINFFSLCDEIDLDSIELAPELDPDLNLLCTVPLAWLPKNGAKEAIDEMQTWWGRMSKPLRGWFNALFWQEPERLNKFLLAPGSIKFHHAYPHGLLTHTLDCARRVYEAAKDDALVNMDVLIMAALAHDIGKADEYSGNEFTNLKLSDRGALVGHRMTTTEWLAVARYSLPSSQQVDEQMAMTVIHAINASHAPDWVGLRQPRTLEALYLASADGLSGHCDLLSGLAAPGQFKNGYHMAFRGNVYITKREIN